MAGKLISKRELLAKLEPATPTLEGIPLDIYETIIKLAVCATPQSKHTFAVTRASRNKTKFIVDVDLLNKILFINHRSRKTITGLVLRGFSGSKTQLKSATVVEELIKGRLYSAFHQEFHNLDIEIHILKRLAYVSHSGAFLAGSLVSMCYPNIKTITTRLFHEDDACFEMRPNDLTCTEAERRAYVSRMLNRMTEGVRSFVCSFIYGYTEYDRTTKLECRYKERDRSEVVSSFCGSRSSPCCNRVLLPLLTHHNRCSRASTRTQNWR